MIVSVKWLVCDVCREPVMGAIGNARTAQEARDDARGVYERRGGNDVCLGCCADLDGVKAQPDAKAPMTFGGKAER